MAAHTSNARRRFVKLTAIGFAVTPFGGALLRQSAEAADMLSESDPQAVSLKYKADATKAADRKDATATCSSCNFYTGKAGDANGPCSVFGGKLVSAKGWCMTWAKKT